MENPLKNVFKREAKAAPAMHSEAFSEYIGQSRRKVQKAIKESGKKAAGRKEINWLKKNKNAPEAAKFKDGKWHFFFGAASGDVVPALLWDEAFVTFIELDYFLDLAWHGGNGAVLRD